LPKKLGFENTFADERRRGKGKPLDAVTQDPVLQLAQGFTLLTFRRVD